MHVLATCWREYGSAQRDSLYCTHLLLSCREIVFVVIISKQLTLVRILFYCLCFFIWDSNSTQDYLHQFCQKKETTQQTSSDSIVLPHPQGHKNSAYFCTFSFLAVLKKVQGNACAAIKKICRCSCVFLSGVLTVKATPFFLILTMGVLCS